MLKSIKIALFCFCILSGCSTVKRSTLLGLGAGVFMGAVGGSLIHSRHNARTAFYGGVSMGLTGGVTGYLAHNGMEKRDARVRRKTLSGLNKHGSEKNPRYYDLGKEKQIFIITDDPKLLRRLQ